MLKDSAGLVKNNSDKGWEMNIREVLCAKKDIAGLCKKIATVLKSKFKSVFETVEELESEVAVILLEKREVFCKEEELSLGFLITSVRNALIDKYFRGKKKLPTELFSDKEKEDKEGKKRPEEFEFKEELSLISFLTVREVFEKLRESFSENEYETLCYYFYSVLHKNEENPFLSEKSASAKYKAWSRLKPKVRKILEEFELEEEEVKCLAHLVMSDCLDKNR
jgi:uncharacterized protein (UPF0335 family)